jgi:hypothetical protein
MDLEHFDTERFLLNATPMTCADTMTSVLIDIHTALRPDAIQIKLGAKAAEMDVDQYRELQLEKLLKVLSVVKSKLHQLLGIRE